MKSNFPVMIRLALVMMLSAAGLSGCYVLNAKHYGDVLDIRSNMERLKAADNKLAAQIAALQPLEHALRSEFATELSSQQVNIRRPSASSVGLAMQSPLLFASGSADISSQGRHLLARLAKALRTAPDAAIIRIIGHTDPVPLNKSLKAGFIDNWGLSTARAAAVARRLIRHGQVNASRIHIEGRALYNPVANNDSAVNMAKNRRVEVFVELDK